MRFHFSINCSGWVIFSNLCSRHALLCWAFIWLVSWCGGCERRPSAHADLCWWSGRKKRQCYRRSPLNTCVCVCELYGSLLRQQWQRPVCCSTFFNVWTFSPLPPPATTTGAEASVWAATGDSAEETRDMMASVSSSQTDQKLEQAATIGLLGT